MPKFRRKYTKSGKPFHKGDGSDRRGMEKEKEEGSLRSSSVRYKDDIDGA